MIQARRRSRQSGASSVRTMRSGALAGAVVALCCVGVAGCHSWRRIERLRPSFTLGADGGTLLFGTSSKGIVFGERDVRIGNVHLQRAGWDVAEITAGAELGSARQWKIRLDGGAPRNELSVGPLSCSCGSSQAASIGLGPREPLWAGVSGTGLAGLRVGGVGMIADNDNAALKLKEDGMIFARMSPRENLGVVVRNVFIGTVWPYSFLRMGPEGGSASVPTATWAVNLEENKAQWPFRRK